MNITILGCGYVGRALCKSLLDEGWTVYATTTSPEKVEELMACSSQVHVCYSRDQVALKALLEQSEACVVSVAPKDGASHEKTYVETALCLAQVIKDLKWKGVLIYTGSTAVYGNANGGWVDEATPVQNNTERTSALVTTEETLLNLEKEGTRICVLRLGEIYGPEREIATKLQRWRSKPIPGDGSNLTNQVHLDDIVGAALHVLRHQLHGVYNVCNETHLPRKEFYARVCEEQGLPPVSWDADRQSFFGGNRKVSNRKLIAAGYKFVHPETV